MTNEEFINTHIDNPYTDLSEGNLLVSEGVLYSYGKHWPLCIWTQDSEGNPVANINTERRSMTSTKHANLAMRCVHQAGYVVRTCSLAEMQQLLKEKEQSAT
jgi:hypothetical protein